jgi:hypothetical protein
MVKLMVAGKNPSEIWLPPLTFQLQEKHDCGGDRFLTIFAENIGSHRGASGAVYECIQCKDTKIIGCPVMLIGA